MATCHHIVVDPCGVETGSSTNESTDRLTEPIPDLSEACGPWSHGYGACVGWFPTGVLGTDRLCEHTGWYTTHTYLPSYPTQATNGESIVYQVFQREITAVPGSPIGGGTP